MQIQPHRKFKPTTSSVPCHIRDIKVFILRKHKYLHSVEQYSKYESLPNQLLLKFLKRVQKAKTLKSFSLKWSYFPPCHVKPDIVKSIFRHQCKNIEKFDVFALCDGTPYLYKNLSISLKNVVSACLYSNIEIRKLQSLSKIEKLTIKLNHEIPNYAGLHTALRRLTKLKNLYFVVSPSAFAGILKVVDHLNIVNQQSINVEISVEGDQEHISLPKLKHGTLERIIKMNFQSIRSDPLLCSLLAEKLPSFKHLKTLFLGFSNISTKATSCLGYLAELPKLENLVLAFSESRLKNIAADVIRRLKLPSSLQTLELSMPLYLKSLVTKNKGALRNGVVAANSTLSWRNQNIFEEEPAFACFFQSLAAARGMKSITLDMNLLEAFNPHYTNFIVSILNRVPKLSSFEAYIKDLTPQNDKDRGVGCFDLAPFLSACSKMQEIEQIEISMPNLLFENAWFAPCTKKLKSFTIGVNEADEDRPVKFTNVSRFVKSLLKTLLDRSPELMNLTLDFAEVVNEGKLMERFNLIQGFQKLEGLGLRFILKDCDRNTAREVGRALQSLPRLNTMVLKFFDSDKHIYGVQNYIKYHRSIRDMLVQLNESSWIDNDYFMDPLRAQIMQDFLVEDEGDEAL